MIELLGKNLLVVLFLVAAAGFLVGRLRLGGFSLGSAAVLFAGLAVGGIDPRLKLPELVYQLGLVIFVYNVALNSGPGFRRTFTRRGLRDNVFAIGVLLCGAGATLGLGRLFGLRPTVAAGLFSGSVTSTPALAAVVEAVKRGFSPEVVDQAMSEPVFAYSVAYPIGVIGPMLAIYLFQRLWKIDYAAEAAAVKSAFNIVQNLMNVTVVATKPEAFARPLGELARERHWRVIFGRIKRGDRIMLFRPEMQLQPGDLVTMVGDNEEVPAVADFLGERSKVELHLDHSVLDFRRLFVSNREAAGRSLVELHLPQRYGAIVTRVRRGDVEFLPSRDTVLELGDRVRVLVPRERVADITKYFGDSYATLGEIDVLSFGIGIAAGLLLGLIAVPLPFGGEFRLGPAGGPLIVGLLLGMRGRTGPFIWQLPHSASLTLRQIGLVLFLAGIGTRGGDAFFAAMRSGEGLRVLVPGLAVTLTVSLLSLVIGYKALRIPMCILTGMVAGMHTQPAALGFANEQVKQDLPNLGYATVYPIATVIKILLAPLLLTLAG